MKYAKIIDNLVETITVSDDPEFGRDWLIENIGGEWVEVEDGQQAGVDYTYHADFGSNGGFAEPQPFDSWTLSAETLLWESPVPYPEDGSEYYWDEDSGDWVEIVE